MKINHKTVEPMNVRSRMGGWVVS